jgi:prevent-host-death family protein
MNMKYFTANEAKQSFGQVMETAQREPVFIKKHNRPTAVVISAQEYDRMRNINIGEFTRFCDEVSLRAKKKGLNQKELSRLLSDK